MSSIDGEWKGALAKVGYLATPKVADSLEFSQMLGMPLLIEGEPGTGKSSLASAVAQTEAKELIRLQCYEGMSQEEALYAWDTSRQLLAISQHKETDVYGEAFLLERPLLRALRAGRGAVLLIDEVDRADEGFEAFLLEFLGEFQVTIPERGTEVAKSRPTVIITSNRTRVLSDALRRRCVYLWCAPFSREQLVAIIGLHVPQMPEALRGQVADVVERLRRLPLMKPPGPAEAIAFARALYGWGVEEVTEAWVRRAMGLLIKDVRDLERVDALEERLVPE